MHIKRLLVSISIVLIFVGLFLILTSSCINLYQTSKNYIGVKNYLDNKPSIYQYVLEIPSIHLKQGIGNNLNKELIMIDNNIIAGHSGHCKVCFFNDLDLLKLSDVVYLFTPIKHIYRVVDINIYNKDRMIVNNELNLITCLKKDNNKRLIIGLKEE